MSSISKAEEQQRKSQKSRTKNFFKHRKGFNKNKAQLLMWSLKKASSFQGLCLEEKKEKKTDFFDF